MSKLLLDNIGPPNYEIEETSIYHDEYTDTFKGIRKARKRKPEMICAIKVINDRISHKIDNKKFLNVVRGNAELNHIATLPVLAYEMPLLNQGNFKIAYEYMSNGSLFDLLLQINSGKIPENWDTMKSILIFGIASGMAYADQISILHKCLIPSNILLNNDYYPKIADFSLYSFLSEFDDLIMGLSPPNILYLAPECLSDDYFYSSKSDAFSFAIILHEILTGKKPYENFNYEKISNGKIKESDKYFEQIPEIYQNLLIKCWDLEIDNRPSFIDIVKDFNDKKDLYFYNAFSHVDEDSFEDYIDQALKKLDFSK